MSGNRVEVIWAPGNGDKTWTVKQGGRIVLETKSETKAKTLAMRFGWRP